MAWSVWPVSFTLLLDTVNPPEGLPHDEGGRVPDIKHPDILAAKFDPQSKLSSRTKRERFSVSFAGLEHELTGRPICLAYRTIDATNFKPRRAFKPL
jgi:hypothetical protein